MALPKAAFWPKPWYCLLGLFFAPALLAMDGLATVDDLLRQLSQSMQERSYKGRFTYEYGGQLDTLEIIHAVKDGVEYERLQHLSGPSREVVRKGRAVGCVNTGGYLLRGGVLSGSQVPGETPISLNQYYHFFLRGEERIAGRNASLIQIAPKDGFRYGATLAVDKASGLPLMWLTTTGQQKVLERLQFIDLHLDPKIDEKDLHPGDKHLNLLSAQSPCLREPPEPKRWALGWLPPGFVLAQVESKELEETMTYTDGLASFSVRIKPLGADQKLHTGLALRGATLAMMSGFRAGEQAYSLVLTGEIPPETAQTMLSSLRQNLAAVP